MKNKIGIFFAFVFGLWIFSSFHLHREHTGELHKAHPVCQICVSHRFLEKFLPQAIEIPNSPQKFVIASIFEEERTAKTLFNNSSFPRAPPA